jgi:hypothetical protein
LRGVSTLEILSRKAGTPAKHGDKYLHEILFRKVLIPAKHGYKYLHEILSQKAGKEFLRY